MDNTPTTGTTTSPGEISISIPVSEQLQTTAQLPAWFRICSRLLHRMHVGTILVVYASLIGFVQLKFQSRKESAFETHSFLMFMSVAAIIIFALSYWILDYSNENSNTNDQLSSPAIHHMILVSVALLSIILAPLSLVLVLLVPPKLMWIGYLTILLLGIAIIACNSIAYVTSLGKNMHRVIWTLVIDIKDRF